MNQQLQLFINKESYPEGIDYSADLKRVIKNKYSVYIRTTK